MTSLLGMGIEKSSSNCGAGGAWMARIFFGIKFEIGGLVIGGDHERETLLEIDPHLDARKLTTKV